MTEQLKQAALADRLRAVARDIRRKPYPISDIIPLLNQAADALTASQPAQAGEVDERVAFEAWHRQAFGYTPTFVPEMGGNYRAHTSRVGWSAWQARASLPTQPAAQATPDPEFDDCPSSPTGKHSESWFGNGDCGHCKTGAQNAPMIATPPQQAAGEPVGEHVGTVVHAKLNGQAKPWVTVALNQDADLPDGAKLYTHPAPAVPVTDADALLDFMEAHRVSVSPEYEGPWCAQRYDDEPQFVVEAEGATPREALRALAAAQAKES